MPANYKPEFERCHNSVPRLVYKSSRDRFPYLATDNRKSSFRLTDTACEQLQGSLPWEDNSLITRHIPPQEWKLQIISNQSFSRAVSESASRGFRRRSRMGPQTSKSRHQNSRVDPGFWSGGPDLTSAGGGGGPRQAVQGWGGRQ